MFLLPILITLYNNIFPQFVLVLPNNNTQIYRYNVKRASGVAHTITYIFIATGWSSGGCSTTKQP